MFNPIINSTCLFSGIFGSDKCLCVICWLSFRLVSMVRQFDFHFSALVDPIQVNIQRMSRLTTIQCITIGWKSFCLKCTKFFTQSMCIRLFGNHISVSMFHPLFEIRFNQRINMWLCVLTVSAFIDHFGFSYPLFSGIAAFNSVHVIIFQRDN